MKTLNMEKLVQTYCEGLDALGLKHEDKAERENGVVVRFTDGNGKFLLIFDKEDPGFVTVLFPNFYPIETEEEYVNCVMAATKATGDLKSAKIMVDLEEKQVSVSAEYFDYSIEEKAQLLKRYIGAVESGIHEFLKALRTSCSSD